MDLRSSRQPPAWSSRAKSLGIALAQRMEFFNLGALLSWVREAYGDCDMSTTTAHHAALDINGFMRPVPGSESLYITLNIRFRVVTDINLVPDAIAKKIIEYGCPKVAEYCSELTVAEGNVHGKFTFLLLSPIKVLSQPAHR